MAPGHLLYEIGSTLIPAWISNYVPSKVWNEITYPFLNFNGYTVVFGERMTNLIPHLVMEGIIYPGWYIIKFVFVKGTPGH